MKKLISLSLIAMLGVSCSSMEMSGNRNPASTGSCSLEKHPSQEHYRLVMGGTPYNNYWYDKNYAEQLMHNFSKKGMCK
jgi:hypothetical protein